MSSLPLEPKQFGYPLFISSQSNTQMTLFDPKAELVGFDLCFSRFKCDKAIKHRK